MEEAITRYIHFLGIIMLSSMLVAENLLITSHLKVGAIKTLVRIDGLYAIGAVITLGAGLFLWLVIGKPSAFYAQNAIFHIKIGLFFLVALISFFPTRFLLKNRNNQVGAIVVPRNVILIKRLELVLLCILPLLASLMANGIGNLTH
jgi:putative membrane protein